MTITAQGLYGGATDPAALVDSTSWQTARFVVPRASSPAAPLSVAFIARSVQVDNASGSWYLVNGRRVPPWTVSAVIALDVPSAQITVAAATPGGQLAEATGEDLVLVVSDQPLAPFPGIYTPPVRAFDWQGTWIPFSGAEAPAPVAVLGALAPVSYVIGRLAVVPDESFGAFGPIGYRAKATVHWTLSGGPGNLFDWWQAVSPESPFVSEEVKDGVLVIAPGRTLSVAAQVESGGGTQGFIAAVQYYAVGA